MTNNTSLHKQANKLTAIIILIGAFLLLLVFWAWWHYVRSNPERTFYAAIENNLQTISLSKKVVQQSAGQTMKQNVELILSPHHIARAETTITEEGPANTVVRTESVGTPRQDFVRYTTIETDQKSTTTGKVLDFSELIDVWGKSQSPDKNVTNGELYGESVLGVIPAGDLSAGESNQLMEFIKTNQVYKFDPSKVKQELKNGRPVYAYEVTVSAEAWVGMLQKFAAMRGLTQLEELDPTSYREAQPIDLTMIVDVWSRNIIGLTYAGGERTETFGSYGVQHEIPIPKSTISVEELQQKLQTVR